MSVEDLDNIKKKFWAKVLSQDAISITFQRSLDLQKVFADYVWLQVSAFDLSQLGLGLANNIAPVDMQPLSIDYKAELALVNETLQGIWMNFTPIDYGELYPWMKDLRTFIEENISEEFKEQMAVGIGVKGFYGITPYERSIYDPVIAREFLRATAHRLRLMKTSDKLYAFIIDQLKDYLEMTGATTDIIYNKIMLLMTAQTQTFILGLSLLGKSRLTHVENGLTQVTYEDAKGNLVTAKIGTLDHIQFGFILGISPLGYGFLLPQKSVYKLPEGKKNPPIVNVIWNKIQGMKNRLVYLAWAFCYDENTEVLTKEGFKKFSELSYNDEIATLNPETDEIEYQHPIAIHKFYYKGKMVYINGRSIDLLVTPEHKLYCSNFYRERKGKNEGYNFIEAISLVQSFKCQKYKFKRTAKWKGVNIEHFELPSYEKNWFTNKVKRVFKEDKKVIPMADWLKLFAWYIAEGDTSTYGKVRIANTNEKNLQEILELCKKLGFNASIYKNPTRGVEKAGIRIYSVQLWKYLNQFGKATEKFIPNWIKMFPPDKLQIFLETITKGDGHKDSRNWKYHTSSKRLADDIQEIAIKAGYTASVGETIGTGYGRNIRIYIVHIDRKRKDTTLTKKPSLIDYDGFVYDVTVPKHHIILVRRNGKICWSSNSNYNRPDEMQDYHASERTQTYMEWHYLRRQIEDWTLKQLGDEARDPMRIRQYQNAMLMLVSWQAKRHKWGYNLFQKMTEDQFFYWWVEYWKSQGLNEAMLKGLYEGFKIWLKPIREKKLYLGMKTQLSRRRLALT